RLLPSYPPNLAEAARKMLTRLGVTVRTASMVTDIQERSVTVRDGTTTQEYPCRTILWAAGVLASPLGRLLSQNTGAPVDKAGRIVVQPDMTIPGHPEIFVIGDLASFTHQTGKPLPGVAQPAIQQGKYVAGVIERRLRGDQNPAPAFHYWDKGNLAVIG